jgi:hypothetical protein
MGGRELPAPKEIEDLIERFEQNIESYKSGHYNETQLRLEFVNPFFKALTGFRETYRDNGSRSSHWALAAAL